MTATSEKVIIPAASIDIEAYRDSIIKECTRVLEKISIDYVEVGNTKMKDKDLVGMHHAYELSAAVNDCSKELEALLSTYEGLTAPEQHDRIRRFMAMPYRAMSPTELTELGERYLRAAAGVPSGPE